MKLKIDPVAVRGCAALLVVAAGLAACTVGPDYHGASPVAGEAMRANAAFVRAPRTGVVQAAAPAAWWEALGDPLLDTLIADALARSSDVRAAQARLRQARAGLSSAQRNALPKGSASAAYLRARSPDTSALLAGQADAPAEAGRGPVQLFNAGFDASWEIDLFGGTRRAIEAASAQAEAVQADLADAHVSLAAEVAQAYVNLRDAQARLVLAKQAAALQERMLTLTRQRQARGAASDEDIERLSTQVETTQANLLPLDVQVTEALDRLAVLDAQAPGALDATLGAAAPLPALPASVVVGDPAALLRQRPDIRAAERRLASRYAQIGEHTADLFPKLSLLGDIGFSATDPAHLARKQNFTWIGVPYLSWNIVDFGRVRAAIGQAEAARDEAEAQYEGVVLGALRDANTALSRYGHQRENVGRLTAVEASARRSEVLTRQRYEAGASSLIDLLDAQRTRYAAEQNSVAARAQALKDFVSLQKGLGLGWQTLAADAGQRAA
jgi:NodT family efflux transporter outer membrane factor (OMF) lipoprotein